MERLKLVNVLKSTFLGSQFYTFTMNALTKNVAFTRDAQSVLHNIRVEGRILSSKRFLTL